jgi:hypothetical protein
MPEMSSSFIGGLIATMWNTAFKMMDKTNTECFMGQDVTEGGWKRIAKWAIPGQPVLELDWSEFDSALTQNALVASFCLLRTCFPKSRKIDKLFIFVMSGTIHTHIAIRQRFIYRVSSGLPSGSPLTSIIGTIANWVLLNYTLLTEGLFGIKDESDFGLAVAGDDTLIKFNNYEYDESGLQFKIEDNSTISETFKRVVNLEVGSDDFNLCVWDDGGSVEDAEYAPSLLKTTIWNGLPGRRCKDLVRSLSCPELPIHSYLDVYEVVDGLTKLPMYTPKSYRLLREFGAFLGRMVQIERDWIQDVATFDPTNDVDSFRTANSLLRLRSQLELSSIVPWYETKLKLRGGTPIPRIGIFDAYFEFLHPT